MVTVATDTFMSLIACCIANAVISIPVEDLSCTPSKVMLEIESPIFFIDVAEDDDGGGTIRKK